MEGHARNIQGYVVNRVLKRMTAKVYNCRVVTQCSCQSIKIVQNQRDDLMTLLRFDFTSLSAFPDSNTLNLQVARSREANGYVSGCLLLL